MLCDDNTHGMGSSRSVKGCEKVTCLLSRCKEKQKEGRKKEVEEVEGQVILFDKRKSLLHITHLPDRATRGTNEIEALITL